MVEQKRRTTSGVPEILSLPPKWLGMYGDFITKNAGAVSQIESALRSLTYIIPGRFRESELASESLHSTIQLLSLYHDSLLAKALSRLPPSHPKPTPSPHNRYTRFWTRNSRGYKRLALLLQTIQYTELLCEMFAKRRYGDKVRWKVVVVLEAVKAAVRLVLLRLTGWRPLLSPPLPEREVDPKALEEPEFDALPAGEEEETADEAKPWAMPRTGLSLPPLPTTKYPAGSPFSTSDFLASKVLTADDIRPPPSLLHRLSSPPASLAEVLYILRPVVYAGMCYKYRDNRKSWIPWLVGLSLEYGAREIAQREAPGNGWGLTGLEREEQKRRGWSMGWWAMRGAFYENVTKSWIHGFTEKLKGKPVLDIVGGVIEDYEYLWDNYYFSTATL